jgi:hypothetical protein
MQLRSAAGMPSGQHRKLFSKCAPVTGGVVAKEPAHLKVDQYRPSGDRQVVKASAVAAMSPSSPLPAAVTTSVGGEGSCDNHDTVLGLDDVIDLHIL